MHLRAGTCKQNVRQLTLAFGADDESCMLTLTVSGHADEGRVAALLSRLIILPKG